MLAAAARRPGRRLDGASVGCGTRGAGRVVPAGVDPSALGLQELELGDRFGDRPRDVQRLERAPRGDGRID